MAHAIARTAVMPQQAALYRFVWLSMLAAIFYVVTMAYAYAQVATPMGAVLCYIVGFVYGNMGRGLATMAVMIVGAGATLGKVSWGLAITVAIGISVIFNAGGIVTMIGVGAGLPFIVGC